MKRLLFGAVLLAAFAFVPPWTGASGESVGAVRGKVLNGTTGDSLVPGLTVALVRTDTGGQAARREASTDASGAFDFSGLGAGAYQLTVVYRAVTYSTSEIRIKDGDPAVEIEVRVFDTIASDGALRARLDHLVLSFDSGVLTVMELLQVENPSNLTIVSGTAAGTAEPTPTLRVPIPVGVTEVSILSGLSETHTFAFQEMLADFSPVLPGNREVALSYKVPYSTKTFTLRKSIAYPTDKISVLMPDGAVRASSSALPDVRTTVLDGRSYLVLSRQGADAGTVIEIELSNLSRTSGLKQGNILVLALAAAGLLGVAALVARRRLLSGAASPAGEGERRAGQ